MTASITEYFTNNNRMRRLTQTWFQEFLRSYNVSTAQSEVLILLLKQPEPLQPKEIARCLQLTPGAVSQLVDSLVENGHVIRTPSPTDRRSTAISLKEDGNDMLMELRRHQKNFQHDMSEILTDDEIEQLLNTQTKILAYLERSTNGKNQS
ncbi:MAG: MarR family transcriptional regulator [Candidatus Saccharibacteria bacterium]|nr:MarR family transcriptional regulator [Candidatus Saccharibacteria bacterium]